VTVPAGLDTGFYNTPGTTYWFAPGVHTLGTGQYSQIDPGVNDTYVSPSVSTTGVTIEYLTIENFVPPGGNGAVNVNAGPGWTITHDTVQDNSPGAGVMVGTDNVLSYNCLTDNGEYGFQTYTSEDVSPLTNGSSNITVTHNEISYNDTYNWEVKDPGCGCSGGGKFWQTDGATVTDNYVHDNANVGLWADTNDNGFTITGNDIASNFGEGLIYEISYNALIENNTFTDNAWGAGAANPGFPTGAIYLSESGGDGRVPNAAGIKTITISGNTFTDNWSGVVLWENSNRFCGSPDNTSSGDCTLVDPSVYNLNTCVQANLQTATPSGDPDYYDNCRWKTQNVAVTGNTFNMTPSAVPGCQGSTNGCGENGIFSENCSNSSNGIGWSPYCGSDGFAISDAITTTQNNTFADNTYNGTWLFMVHDQSTIVPLSTWQKTWNQDLTSS
jgi:hypothetical protein